MAKVFFFGYGAYKDNYRLAEIIGKPPEGGEGALLEGYDLGVQNINNIPKEPKEILAKVWGNNFQAYTMKKGSGYIQGRIWLLDEEDLQKIKEWEFINKSDWRELVSVTVKTSDGKTISTITDKSKDKYEIDKFVDGLNYEPNLNREGKKYYSEEDEYKIELMRKEIKEYYRQYAS
ncbi:MAG: hypothetical protein WC744_03080 [Patescibacteria group bacterium]|jgi:hypothetical protein